MVRAPWQLQKRYEPLVDGLPADPMPTPETFGCGDSRMVKSTGASGLSGQGLTSVTDSFPAGRSIESGMMHGIVARSAVDDPGRVERAASIGMRLSPVVAGHA